MNGGSFAPELAGCANLLRSFVISEPRLIHLNNGGKMQCLPQAPEIISAGDLHCPGPPTLSVPLCEVAW